MSSIISASLPRRHWSVLLLSISIISLALSYVRVRAVDGSSYPRTVLQSASFLDYASYERFHVLNVIFPWVVAVVIGCGLWQCIPSVSMLRSVLIRRIISLLSSVTFVLSICFSSFVLFFAPPSGFQVIAKIDGYSVGLTQTYTYDPFVDSSLALTVIRSDGKVYTRRLQYMMEPRDKVRTVCETLSIKAEGDNLYFLCDSEHISHRTPYVNIQEREMYFGWGSNATYTIDELPFK